MNSIYLIFTPSHKHIFSFGFEHKTNHQRDGVFASVYQGLCSLISLWVSESLWRGNMHAQGKVVDTSQSKRAAELVRVLEFQLGALEERQTRCHTSREI